ncbi:UDP-glucose 4-epimerase GalE [Rossellomorea aquimaris]|uniref:UDP-glucose 4-epimerase GalE n=1 Tax=Rossellomorea aquimaris TaxID=189382 RepID=UPI001CD401E0|nr:UDP-glucose 4-epimerase GalE [Rossellomorea aquimaris]MCA1061465.1 UDP-glucose 4-epimerase GalE [Rossellomorea aquimaris]
MTILITGGAGYIGSHTCIELLNAGHEIIVVDNFSNSKPEALKRVSEITRKYFRTYCLDLQNREGLEKVFTDNEIEAVIHFAGSKAVGESVHFPLEYYENNMNSTITLCEVMKKFKVNKLVFSSSATVYGATDKVPITEETPLKATNPYGRTKQMIEELLQDLYDSDREWSIALLRYFNPVGAHESGRIGEDPNGIPNNLMPYISQVAIGKLETLQVFGNDYPTIDGTGIRDYIHVVDLALGHVKALERLLTNTGIDAYNLGTGKGYSVLEVLSAYERAAGKTIPYKIVEKRQGDVAVCYADTSKAKEKLNWEAVKGIDEMCKDSLRWQQHNSFGYEKQSKMLVKN